jgi:gamma-glutamylcyclotransferase (GGCT)/AIG2-like uncharacterized protein YtfP
VRLFVYGTLMQGYGNHRRLGSARFIGGAISTAATYRMYDGGFPILVDDPLGARVRGELYEVDRATLTACDHLEGHPHWYRRRKRRFVTDDGTTYKAWVYIMPEQLAASRSQRVQYGTLTWPSRKSPRRGRENDDNHELENADDPLHHQ